LLKKEILNTPPKLQNGVSEEKNLKKEKTPNEVPKQKTQNKENGLLCRSISRKPKKGESGFEIEIFSVWESFGPTAAKEK